MAENQVEGGYVKLRSEIAGILAAGRERARECFTPEAVAGQALDAITKFGNRQE